MSRHPHRPCYWLLCACLLAPVAYAQQSVGMEVLLSDDADDSRVAKSGIHFDFTSPDIEHYRGIKIEQARFAPQGGRYRNHRRVYYRFADTGQDQWKWNGALGTDGHTWLGNASVYKDAARRQEYFVERELVETPTGVDQRLYATFIGAAWDLPVDDRNVLTFLAGVQDFTGDNTRLHLRGRYIHVLDEERGLSVQLRTRQFHSSHPHEADYYSPRWYAEAMPVLQLRRVRGDWTYRVAGGIGRAGDSDSSWRNARLLEASVASPKTHPWFVKLDLIHTNTPGSAGYRSGYDYTMLMLQVNRRL